MNTTNGFNILLVAKPASRDGPCMFGYPHMFGCPCMFGCPLYVWTPPICLDACHMFRHPCICLDIPVCLNIPICLDAPHMFGWPTYLGGILMPQYICTPSYVWTPSICLDAPVHTQHIESMLCHTKVVSICPIHFGCPHMCGCTPCMFGCPHMF